jgi:hypothetical protein
MGETVNTTGGDFKGCKAKETEFIANPPVPMRMRSKGRGFGGADSGSNAQYSKVRMGEAEADDE